MITVQGCQRSSRWQMLLIVLRVVLLGNFHHLVCWGVLLGMSLGCNLRVWLSESFSPSLGRIEHVFEVFPLVACLLLDRHKFVVRLLLLRNNLNLRLIDDSWVLRQRGLVLLISKVRNHVHSLSFFPLIHDLTACYIDILLSRGLLLLTFIAID